MKETRFGLPNDVVYCKNCTISNQRPNTSVEFKNTKNTKKTFIHFDENSVCDACNYAVIKKNINWQDREKELLEL